MLVLGFGLGFALILNIPVRGPAAAPGLADLLVMSLAAVPQVARCLGDPELPVRVDAVVSLRHFLEEMEDVEPVAPALPQLLNSIFGLMNQVGGWVGGWGCGAGPGRVGAVGAKESAWKPEGWGGLGRAGEREGDAGSASAPRRT